MKKILIWCVRTLLITAIVQVCMPALAVDSSGAFQVEVTVATSPFHGLEPSLALRYDSRLGNGPVGFGWSLQGLSGIARKSSSDGTPRFDDTDRFYLDGNELLACAPDPRSPSARRAACKFPSSTGQPFYALQESFERISLDRGGSAMVWTVWERSGTRRLYQPASDGAAWHLARVEDTMGNAVEYRYSTTPSDEPERLERIEYNGTAVIFHWQPRPDVTSVANGHALLTLRQRLASVEVRVDGQMARTYALSYNQRPLTARSTVASIQEFGRDAIISGDGSVSGTALPASSYRYLSDGAPPANGWLSAPARLAPATLPAAETPTPRYNGRYIDVDHGADCNAFIFQGFTYGDFDGDGRTEPMAILRCPQRGDDRNILRIKAWQFVSNGRTLLGTVDMAMDDDFNDILPIDERGRRFEVFPADTNGDGRQDLIVLSWRSTSGDLNGPLELMVNVAMSDGRGGLTWATPDFRPTGWITAVIDAINGPRCAVGDFAATRRAALACVFQSGGGTQFIGHAQAQRDGSLLPTAPVVLADSPWPMTPPDVAMVTFPITTGDVNGDGRDDLMVLAPNVAEMAACPLTETHPHCTVHLDLLTGLSDGVGFTFTRQATSWSYDPGAIVTRLFAGDVDGDGKADYLVLNGIGDTLAEIDVARSYRDGAFQLGSQTLPSALSTLGLQVALGDANGDGATDLMILARFDRPVVGCPESWELGVMFRVLSNRDGSFALPDRWDDCSAAPSMPVNSNDFVPSVGSFRAADTNGDGLPDFLLGFQHPEGSTLAIAFVDAPTRAPALDARNWIATDVDGDGRVDLIRIAPGSSQTDVLVAKQLDTSFRVDPVTLPAFDNLAPAAWHVADVDGDGRPDLVHVQCESAAPPGPACDLGIDTFLGRAGGGYAQQPHARLPAAVSGTDGNLASWRVADLDGKGRASLLFLSSARDGVGGVVIHAFTFDGGWQWLAAAGPFNLGSQPPFSTALDDLLNWQVADIDGDGRTDLVHVISNVDSTRVSVLHSLGRNRWELSDTLVPNPPGYSWYLYPEVRSATRWHVLDVNGDGLSDLYRTLPVANGMVVQSLLSLGDGRWSEATFKPDFASSAEARQAAATDDWIALPGGAADLPRLIRIDPGPDSSTQRIVTSLEALPGGLWRVRREEVHDAADPLARVRPAWIGTTLQGPGRRGVFRVDPVRDGGVAAVAISSLVSTQIDDRLTAMRTQAGGSLEIKYAPFADFQPASPADGCLLPAGLDVAIVSTLTVADGRADGPAPTVTHFDYSCPRWLPDLRRFDGWEQILSTTPAAVHRDEGRTLDIYSHSSACGASQRATGPVDSQRHPIGQRDYIEPYPAGDDPWACLPRRRITQVMETPQDLPLTTSMTFEYDHHGNIISMARRAVVNDGTAEGTLTATYAPNVSAWIVATPANVEWHSGSSSHGRLLAQRRYCYDDDTTATCGLPPTSSGLVTRQIDIVDPAAPEGRTTRFGYDEAGNLHSIRNANGHETTIDFDPYHLVYPTRTTDAMGRDAGQVDWDPVLSQPLRIRNGTGAPLVIDYDVLGRAKTVTLPAGGKMTREYPNAGDPERQSILDTWHDGSGIDTWRRTYFDGLMRPYRLARRASPIGRYERTVNYGDSSSLPWESSTWRCVS